MSRQRRTGCSVKVRFLRKDAEESKERGGCCEQETCTHMSPNKLQALTHQISCVYTIYTLPQDTQKSVMPACCCPHLQPPWSANALVACRHRRNVPQAIGGRGSVEVDCLYPFRVSCQFCRLYLLILCTSSLPPLKLFILERNVASVLKHVEAIV